MWKMITLLGRSEPRSNRSAAMSRRRVPLSVESLEERRVLSTVSMFSTLAPAALVGPSSLIFTHPQTALPKFVVSMPASAPAGSAFNITIKAEDSFGYLITNYASTPTITASDGQPVTVTGLRWSGGIAVAAVVLNGPDSVNLVVAAPGFLNASSTIQITAASVSDSLWSGYVAQPGKGSVTAVGATWVEPTVTGPGDTSIWVGIDGYGNSTVEQIGVQSQQVNGVTVYTPWIEFYGDVSSKGVLGGIYYQTNLPGAFVVRPGDTISASVALVAGTSQSFQFKMTDVSSDGRIIETYSSTFATTYVTPNRSTAEWIIENNNNGAQPFANFGQLTFTGAWATVNGVTTGINPQLGVRALNLQSSQGNDITSNPPIFSKSLGGYEPSTGFGSSTFTVSWVGLVKVDGFKPPILPTQHVFNGTAAYSLFGASPPRKSGAQTVLNADPFAIGDRDSFFDLF